MIVGTTIRRSAVTRVSPHLTVAMKAAGRHKIMATGSDPMKTHLLRTLLLASLTGSAPFVAHAEGLLKEFVDHLMEHGAREAAAELPKIVRCWRTPQACDKSVDPNDVAAFAALQAEQKAAAQAALREAVRRAFPVPPGGNSPIAPDRSLTGR